MIRTTVTSKIVILLLVFLLTGCIRINIPKELKNIEGDWDILKCQSLNIYHMQDQEELYNNCESVDKVYLEVSDKFKQFSDLKYKTDIYVIPNYGNASTTNGNIFISESIFNSERGIVTLRHEIIHVFTKSYDNSDISVPAWFIEGIAQYYQHDLTNDILIYEYKTRVVEAFNDGHIINFNDLIVESGTSWKDLDIRLAYSQSASMYYFLIKNYEEVKIIGLFYTEGDFNSNLSNITGMNLAELESMWKVEMLD